MTPDRWGRRRSSAKKMFAVVLIVCTATSPEAQTTGRRWGPETLPPSIAFSARIDEQKPIDFHASLWPDTVYVNQQLFYQVGVFLNTGAKSRLAGNPEFVPPEFGGFIAYELATGRRNTEVDVRSSGYDAHIFYRALFPVTAGKVGIPSPQLSYRLRATPGYFSRESGSTISAESTSVVVLPLPEDGRPVDFTGAVGRFRAAIRVDGGEFKVGEPAILTLRVEGNGNIKLLTRPLLELSWATLVNGSERLSVDTLGMVVRGSREFDWILTPSSVGRAVIPSIRYSYFDPWTGQYRVATADSLAVSIARGTLVRSDASDAGSLLPLRDAMHPPGFQQRAIRFTRTVPVSLWRYLFPGAPAVALLLFAVLTVQRKHLARSGSAGAARPSLESILGSAGREGVPPEDGRELARALRRGLYDALSSQLDVPVQRISDRRELERLLRRRGAERATVGTLMELLAELDAAAFSGASYDDPTEMRSEVDTEVRSRVYEIMRDIVDQTPRTGVRRPLFGGKRQALVLVLALQSATDGPADVTLFQSARDAYMERQFVQASTLFGELAARQPESVDVLLNWGTAAWAGGDTVGAVVAWRRAARLDPLAADVQERIHLLPASSREAGDEGFPVAPELTLLLSAALWITGWGMLCVIIVRRARSELGNSATTGRIRAHSWLVLSRGAALFILVGAVAGLYSWQSIHDENIHPAFVVVRPDVLRAATAFDAAAMGGVATGDLVRLRRREDGWIEVTHSDGRVGWLLSERVVPIAGNTAHR